MSKILGNRFGDTPPEEFAVVTLENQPTSYSQLEEIGRSLSQISIMTYGIRFDTSAITELYDRIEKGVLKIKERGDEDNFDRLYEVQKNLIEYIYQIAAYAKEQSLTSVDAATIKIVQFCPVYPFDNF